MNKKGCKYLLIIVETRKGAQTDDAYIRETIKKYYIGSYDFIPKFIYMESKSAYNSKKINHEIKEYVTYADVLGIILCIDIDDYDTSTYDVNLNENIKKHCETKKYNLVWFCKNVEDVYYNTIVDKDKKVIKAKQFIQNKMINSVDEKYLRSKDYSNYHSNILNVLDKYYKK